MKTLKFSLMAFMALFFSFGLVGCGGDDDDDDYTKEKTGTSDISAVVMVSSDVINYFDGHLTVNVGGNTKTATLKKSEGTKIELTENHALYRFSVTVKDVQLSSTNATEATATLTYTRNSTAAPTTNFDFMDGTAIEFEATHGIKQGTSARQYVSGFYGVAASVFSVIAESIEETTSTKTDSFLYSTTDHSTANFDELISSAKGMATNMENYDPSVDEDIEL